MLGSGKEVREIANNARALLDAAMEVSESDHDVDMDMDSVEANDDDID